VNIEGKDGIVGMLWDFGGVVEAWEKRQAQFFGGQFAAGPLQNAQGALGDPFSFKVLHPTRNLLLATFCF
jgi:hypothetical protein